MAEPAAAAADPAGVARDVPVPEADKAAARALAATVRAATAGLPFGAEPLDFLVALEAEADRAGAGAAR